jgi:hypothetical protein
VFGRTQQEPPPQERVGAPGAHTTAVEQARARGGRPPEGLILLVFALLTLAASAYVLLSDERSAERDPVQKAARGEIGTLDQLSLVREQNLRKLLAKIDAGPRPFVTNLRIATTRLNLIVRDSDGIRKVVSVDAALHTDESDFGTGTDDAVRAARIDAAAPERIVRAVLARTHVAPAAVDYLVLSPSGISGPGWTLYLTQGPVRDRHWSADAHGGRVRRLGEP